MITSLIGFLVCVACLCSTTWAWFSDNAPSHGNEIKMADTFSLTVAVEGGGEAIPDASGNIALTAGVDYTVTMTLPAESASGYCILTAGDVEYYTDYLTAHTEATPRVTSFTLTVNSDQTVVFTKHWGIYHLQECAVSDGGVLVLQ